MTGPDVQAKLLKIINDMPPDDAAMCLTDLVNGREGWYHDLVLCYVDADALAQCGRGAAKRAADAAGFVLQYRVDRQEYVINPPPRTQPSLLDA